MHIKTLSTLVLILSVLAVFGSDTQAKSVYAITDHGYPDRNAKVAAYGVEGDRIDEQYTYELAQINYPTGVSLGPVGITSGDGYLFVTHENTGANRIDGIQLIDARTMLDQGVLEVTDSPNFAGIVYGHGNDKVYAIERLTDDLHIFSWDPDEQTLTESNGSPVTLAQIGDYGCGLALDEIEAILYVTTIGTGDASGHTERSNKVYCYDSNDPNSGCTDIITIPNAHDETQLNAVGVAVYNDGNGTRYLYTGAYTHPAGSHDYLVRIDLDLYDADPNDPNSFLEYEDVGASVTAIAVDQDTGLVYITTSNNQVQVWNTEMPFGLGWSMSDFETENISGPAGLCVSDIDFVPPFGVEKVDDIANACMTPRAGEEITYTISYAYNWTEEGDPTLSAFTQIYIEDHLPNEVDFVSADPDAGYYDAGTHSYVWVITPENYGSPSSIDITVEIN